VSAQIGSTGWGTKSGCASIRDKTNNDRVQRGGEEVVARARCLRWVLHASMDGGSVGAHPVMVWTRTDVTLQLYAPP
jgi:hypothetical protein